jgi:hypothetical protein
LSEQRKKLDEAVDKLATDPADRIAKVNKELETTQAALEALREKDGSNSGRGRCRAETGRRNCPPPDRCD